MSSPEARYQIIRGVEAAKQEDIGADEITRMPQRMQATFLEERAKIDKDYKPKQADTDYGVLSTVDGKKFQILIVLSQAGDKVRVRQVR